MDFYFGPRTRNRQHSLAELWLVNATRICKTEEASPPFSSTIIETGHGTDHDEGTCFCPAPQEAWDCPTQWHIHRFLAVLWDWVGAKPQLHQNKEGTGEYRGGEGGGRQDPPSPAATHTATHTQAQVFVAKALRTNPENSVMGGGSVSLPEL